MSTRRSGARRARSLAAVLTGVVVAPALASCGGGGSSGGTPTLNWYIGKQAGGWIEHAISTCNAQAAGAYKIKFQELPARATDQREQLVRRLAANDSSIDIIGMDVIWTAEFANAGWIQPFPDSARAALTDGVLKGPVQSGTYQGKLYAAPFTSNTQLLWYRKDLVSNPPRTWDALINQAVSKHLKIQIQGAKAESAMVTFNALEASAGGSIVKNAGAGKNATVTLPQGPTVAALSVLKKLASSSAADPELNTAQEDTSRQAFERGGSLYEVNYPFIYPSAADATVAGGKSLQSVLGWARYPRVEADLPSKPPLGGFNLGIAEHSKHPALDVKAITCIRSAGNQRFAAINGGNPPTLSSLYDDQGLQQGLPVRRRAALLDPGRGAAAGDPRVQRHVPRGAGHHRAVRRHQPDQGCGRLRSLMKEALKSEAVL